MFGNPALLGAVPALLYVAALFAVMHIGFQSVLDLLFVFGVGVYFGWAAASGTICPCPGRVPPQGP